jgi:hypothetical protein
MKSVPTFEEFAQELSNVVGPALFCSPGEDLLRMRLTTDIFAFYEKCYPPGEVPLLVDWVNCPICGETDMRREFDAEKNSLIFCVNHACKSNSGPERIS